jgi:hypothetical protein
MKQSISVLWHFSSATKHDHPMSQNIEDTADVTILDCVFQYLQVQRIVIEQLNVLIRNIPLRRGFSTEFRNLTCRA